ncbi:hypothetical protein ACQ4LE_001673 [Meloidogyne hapla]
MNFIKLSIQFIIIFYVFSYCYAVKNQKKGDGLFLDYQFIDSSDNTSTKTSNPTEVGLGWSDNKTVLKDHADRSALASKLLQKGSEIKVKLLHNGLNVKGI